MKPSEYLCFWALVFVMIFGFYVIATGQPTWRGIGVITIVSLAIAGKASQIASRANLFGDFL